MSHGRWFVTVLFVFLLGRPAVTLDLAAELARAKPGAVVQLPAGTYGGGVEVPTGVTLRGDGYQKTIIDSLGAAVALSVKGKGVRIENLSVRSTGTGVEIAGAEDVTLSRLMIAGGSIGVRVSHAITANVENVIVSKALIGISLSDVTGSKVANCTVSTADACGLSVSASTDTAMFNNVVANAGTGVVVGSTNKNLAVDYNLYLALSAGKIEGELQRPSVPTWRDVSGGLDAHSVQLNVAFVDQAKDDFHVVSTLSWNPARATTAGWGVTELAAHKAPAIDIDGRPRSAAPDLAPSRRPVRTPRWAMAP